MGKQRQSCIQIEVAYIVDASCINAISITSEISPGINKLA